MAIMEINVDDRFGVTRVQLRNEGSYPHVLIAVSSSDDNHTKKLRFELSPAGLRDLASACVTIAESRERMDERMKKGNG